MAMTEPADRVAELVWEHFAPKQHRTSTDACLSIPDLHALAQSGDSVEGNAAHVLSCRRCRVSVMASWDAHHPSLRQLVSLALDRHPLGRLLSEHVDTCQGDCQARLNGAFVSFFRRLAQIPESLKLGVAAPAYLGAGQVREDLGDVTVIAEQVDGGTVSVSARGGGETQVDTVTGRLEPGSTEFAVEVGETVHVETQRPPDQVIIHDIQP